MRSGRQPAPRPWPKRLIDLLSICRIALPTSRTDQARTCTCHTHRVVTTPPTKSSAREITEAAIEGSAGLIPVVGSPLAVAFALTMGWAYNKRMTAWLEGLAEAVTELQEQSAEWTFEALAQDEVFVDAVAAASRAAQATHSAEKLAALRNGVLNSLAADAPSLDEQARFFRLIEEFTPAHLRLLSFLDEPGRFFDEAGVARPTLMMGGRSSLLQELPEFRDRRDWYDLLSNDMAAAMLTNHGGLHVTQSGASLWEPATSPLGKRFLAFIRQAPAK